MDCDTKYPIVLIHGAGSRDRKHFKYWGRIPGALEKHGATLFFGHQDGWGSIEYNAGVLKDNLHRIIIENGCEKINLIAHSKGGIDARYMISSLNMDNEIASLTTLATTHHGSKTIDVFLKFPKWSIKAAALVVNFFSRRLGDKKPDFYRAIMQLGTEFMKSFNEQNPDADSVYYQSYAAVMKNAFSDFFLFIPNLVVGLIEGESDGLVTPESAAWTNFKGVLRGTTNRGISHMDEVDARRMNLTKKVLENGTSEKMLSDIRSFYISVAAGLKQMGF